MISDFETFKQSAKFNKKLYEFGRKHEKQNLDLFRKFFEDETIHLLPEGSYFDYEGHDIKIELKTRNCSVHKYLDTAITTHKFIQASLQSKTVYFIFEFTDGIFYFKYDPKDTSMFDTIRTYDIRGVSHKFIPKHKLVKLK